MDLDDSFTTNLLHRTMARREELNKKLGLTPEVPASAKRRRTPLADERNNIDEIVDGDEDNSESPKRQCISASGTIRKEEGSHSNPEAHENKENSAVPVLGLRGLAALKRRNQDNRPEPATSVSNSCVSEHEESQGFTKSVSTAKLSYTYKDGDTGGNSLIRDRLKMFEQPGAASCVPRAVQPASASKKPPVVPGRAPSAQQSHIPSISVSKSTSDVDPTEMSLAARRALFEAPILASATADVSPEKLSVSQRTALFERAMVSPSNKTNRFGRSPSPARKGVNFAPASPVHAEPGKIPFPSPAPAASAPSPSPAKHLPPSPGPALPACSPLKSTVPCSPVKAAIPCSPFKDVPHVSPHPMGTNLQPSPSILRKTDGNAASSQNNGMGKVVSFNLSPESPDSKLQVPKSPKLGQHTAQMQQRLLEQTQKSTSTSRMVEKTIAERRKEMEKLLFNKHDETLQDDEGNSLVSQSEDSDATQDSKQDSVLQDNSTLESSETSGGQDDSSLASIGCPPSIIKPFEDDSEINDALAEALQSEEEEETENEMSTPVPQSRTVGYMADATTEPSEDRCTPLLHSLSVYRRQKQALCTPPVKVVQRRPLDDSPPSPPPQPQVDRNGVEELRARIQGLQESLHCQEVQVRQASQALFLCSAKPELFGSAEHIEGERLLLIASQKRNAYRAMLERLKTEAAFGQSSGESNAMGTLTMSDIRLPLKHDFLSAQMAGMNGDSMHFFFCLIRYQDKVIATEMLSTKTSDITAGTLSFSNHICIQELQNNFAVHFEVYALQSSVENLSHHERKQSLRRDLGKAKAKKLESKSKLSPVMSSPVAGQMKERNSNFGLVGQAQFTVANCSQKVLVMDKVPKCSPLDGRLYIKIQLCTQQPVKEQGFLTMFEDVSGFGAWHRRWVVLNGNHLAFWKYPDQVQTEVPIGSIDLRTCVTPEVGVVSGDVCARKNTFMLFCVHTKSQAEQRNFASPSHGNMIRTTKHLVSADTREERVLWCQKLNDALQTIRRWDPEAMKPSDQMFY